MTSKKQGYNAPYRSSVGDVTRNTGTPPLEFSPHGFMDDTGLYVQAALYQNAKVEIAVQGPNTLLKFTLEPAAAARLGALLTKMAERGKTMRRA